MRRQSGSGHEAELERLRTELARVSEELRDATGRLEQWTRAGAAVQPVDVVLSSVSDAFFALDREWRFTYVNDRATEVLERSREALLGQKIWDEFPPAIGSTFDREYHRAVETGQPVTFEEYYAPLDTWFEVRAYPGAEGLAVYFLDVTERRRVAQALADAERARAEREAEREALLEAERAARERADRLQGLTAALSGAHSQADVVTITIEQGLAAVEADTGAVLLLDAPGGNLEVIAEGGSSPFVPARWLRMPIDAPVPVCEAARTGVPVVLRSADERATRFPATRDWALPLPVSVALPLVVEGRSIGVLAVNRASADDVSEDAIAFMDAFARQCAQALDRVRLFEAERQARVRAEKAMEEQRAAEERFRTLADNIPQLAWMADPAGKVLWFNRQWVSYTGVDVEDTVQPGWREGVYHPEHQDRILESFRRALAAGEPWEGTFPLRNRSGDYRWFLSRAVPLRDAQGGITRWFGTNTDVTVQLEAEEALRRAKEQAERANRVKAEFLAAMSHDLRTPMNSIIGYVDLLELGIPGTVSELQGKAFERIKLNSQHLLGLIEDILSFAKVEAGRLIYDLQEIRVAALVGSIAPLVVPAIERQNLAYEVEPVEADLGIIADLDRTRQILLNLIGNATKFTEPGGRIRVSAKATAESVEFHVSDTGPGIPSDRLEQIFEPFIQLEPGRVEGSQRGIGLGLAISLDLARAMGGDIAVESTVGVGSKFTLTLPRSVGGVSVRLASGERRRRPDRRSSSAQG